MKTGLKNIDKAMGWNEPIVLTPELADDIALRAVAGYKHIQAEQKAQKKKRLELYGLRVFSVFWLLALPFLLIIASESNIQLPSAISFVVGVSWGLYLVVLLDASKEKWKRFGFEVDDD